MNKTMTISALTAAMTASLGTAPATLADDAVGQAAAGTLQFTMVPSAGAAACLPNARAKVLVSKVGNNEVMQVAVSGLPPQIELDLFLTQLPKPPFGMSWYQGDIETNQYGRGKETFIGRFNEETFIVAPGSGPAPDVHDGSFPDAGTNPITEPVHTYHLGIWFNSPDDAIAAGCPGVTTPFNGEHTAGIQVLTTSNFPDLKGPLFRLKP